jgi:hypothetical protein
MRLVVPGLAALVALAGCGGENEPLSKAGYERETQAIFERVEQDHVDTSGNTPQEQAAALEEARDRVRQVAEDFDELSPPSAVADAHDDFVAGMRGVADDMAPVIEAVRNGDRAEVQRLAADDSYIGAETRERLTSARAAFGRAGIEINQGFP